MCCVAVGLGRHVRESPCSGAMPVLAKLHRVDKAKKSRREPPGSGAGGGDGHGCPQLQAAHKPASVRSHMSVWHKRKAKSHGKDRFLEVPFGGSEAQGRVREEDRRRRRPDGAAWGKQAQRLTLLQTGWSRGPGRPTRPCAPRPTPPFSAAVIFSPLGPHSSSSLNYDSQAARPHPSCCHPALPGRLAALISNGHQAAPASLCVRAGDPQLLCSPSSALSLRATQADLLLKTKGSRFRRRPHRATCPLHLALSLRRPRSSAPGHLLPVTGESESLPYRTVAGSVPAQSELRRGRQSLSPCSWVVLPFRSAPARPAPGTRGGQGSCTSCSSRLSPIRAPKRLPLPLQLVQTPSLSSHS